jgi:P4 family phage/plasmid primase-like protien
MEGRSPIVSARPKPQATEQQLEGPRKIPFKADGQRELNKLIQSFGQPGFPNANGKLSRLNEPFWAQLLASEEIAVFEPDERQFYWYVPELGLFVPRSEDSIRKDLSDRINRAAHEWGGRWFALQQFRSAAALSGIIAHLRGELEQKNFFTSNNKRVHLANCVLRFNPDGTFVTENFSSQMRSRNRSPILYVPGATCPNFENSILGHVEQDDRLLLQKYAGQCLLGRNLTQRILILDGEGGASKGAFVLIVRAIIGPSNAYELRTNHLEERFEIGRMVGKTLLLGADVRANFMAGPGASRLKALVGGDMLEAERKGSNQTFFVDGNFNVLLTSNSRLRVRLEGDQSAWSRRLTIARYDKPFSGKKIPEIHEHLLRTEGPGILNWILEGTRKLLEDIAQDGDIALSQRQHDHIKSLLLESDSLRLFVKQSISRFEGSDLAVSELVESYMKFCIDSGWNPIPANVVYRQLDEILLELFAVSKSNSIPRHGSQVRGYRNLKFRLPTDEDRP